MRLILIGPPGVGKGTQAALLEQRLGVRPLSSGLIFRQEIEAGTDLGEMAKRYIDHGRLVPNGITIQMMAKRLRTPEIRQKGFLLDGFPRTIEQAEALTELLRELDQAIDCVVSLEVSNEVLVARLSGRMGCTKCGAIYHQVNKPPKREWLCDECNSPLFVRSDDTAEAIQERLRIFSDTTKPVIEYYERMGSLVRVDAQLDPEEVYKRIVTCTLP